MDRDSKGSIDLTSSDDDMASPTTEAKRPFVPKPTSSNVLKAGMPEVNWNAHEICLKDYHIAQLPDCRICPSLVKLSSEAKRLHVFPPNFFENMHSLKVLDLSHSGIISFPPSITGLGLLEELLLRDCKCMTKMPTEIGMLTKLKVFDMEGTEIMFIPKQLRKLHELEVLRVSLSQHAEFYINNKKGASIPDTVIPRNFISRLKKLKELCITLPPRAGWWDGEVRCIQEELCHLENLETLRWHLPSSGSLRQFLLLERNDQSPVYQNLSNLTLTVGHDQYTISHLPRGIEEMFEKSFKNCLRWIGAEGRMDGISKLIARAEALFLLHHWTIENLLTLDLTRLKYCLLAGCKKMKSIVETDEEDAGSGEKGALQLLEYLSVHCMNKLQRIWKGPIAEGSLSKLTVMALHKCPELSVIFTPTMVQNLSCLIELTVEECPKVRSLITTDQSHNINIKGGPILPSLERIYILDLPEMDTLFGSGYIVEKLGSLFVYACTKLRSLHASELPQIKKIAGEIEWWEVLDCDHKSTWEDIFVDLGEDAIEEIHDDGNSLQRFLSPGLDQELSNVAEDPAAKGWVLKPDEDGEITFGVEEGSSSDDGQDSSIYSGLEGLFSNLALLGPVGEAEVALMKKLVRARARQSNQGRQETKLTRYVGACCRYWSEVTAKFRRC